MKNWEGIDFKYHIMTGPEDEDIGESMGKNEDNFFGRIYGRYMKYMKYCNLWDNLWDNL